MTADRAKGRKRRRKSAEKAQRSARPAFTRAGRFVCGVTGAGGSFYLPALFLPPAASASAPPKAKASAAHSHAAPPSPVLGVESSTAAVFSVAGCCAGWDGWAVPVAGISTAAYL